MIIIINNDWPIYTTDSLIVVSLLFTTLKSSCTLQILLGSCSVNIITTCIGAHVGNIIYYNIIYIYIIYNIIIYESFPFPLTHATHAIDPRVLSMLPCQHFKGPSTPPYPVEKLPTFPAYVTVFCRRGLPPSRHSPFSLFSVPRSLFKKLKWLYYSLALKLVFASMIQRINTDCTFAHRILWPFSAGIPHSQSVCQSRYISRYSKISSRFWQVLFFLPAKLVSSPLFLLLVFMPLVGL